MITQCYYQTQDLFKALEENKLPTTLRPQCSYSRILACEVFPVLMQLPQFQPWLDSLDVVDVVAIYTGSDAPTINTSECLSRSESSALNEMPQLMPSLFESMCAAVMQKRLPYEEVFAIVLDSIHAMNYKHYKTLGTLH
ncbi:hypothetical protein NP764_003967 [Salmonella enterica]|nr:hypothetical protein [Salmonella enterica]